MKSVHMSPRVVVGRESSATERRSQRREPGKVGFLAASDNGTRNVGHITLAWQNQVGEPTSSSGCSNLSKDDIWVVGTSGGRAETTQFEEL